MKVVIVGGNAAGLSAASKARRVAPEAEVVVLEKGRDVSYAQCGLPYWISGVVRDERMLVHYSAGFFREERGIDLRTGQTVEGIDLGRRELTGSSADGRPFILGYDRLVLATGAYPFVPPWAGVDAVNVFTLHTLEDARRLKRFLSVEKPKRAAVVGGGYVGLEMCEAFRRLGLEVTLLEQADQVMVNLDQPLARRMEEELARRGVSLLLGRPVERLDLDQSRRCVGVVTAGQSAECDLVLVAVGLRPNVSLAAEAGLRLGASGAIAVGPTMATERPNVFACGDCCQVKHLVTNRPAWIPLGTTANKQGRVAGANAVGERQTFPGVVGSAGLKVFDLEVARTGLNLAQAQQAGFQAEAVEIRHPGRASYYPDSSEMTLRLVVETGTGRLLGAQGVGREVVAKRIDLYAAALCQGLSAEDVAAWDLTYAPPFAPVWDPVLIAANAALRR